MSILLRKLLAPFMDEATDGTEGGAGGAVASDGVPGEGEPTGSQDDGQPSGDEGPKSMLEAMEQVLTPKEGDGVADKKPEGEGAPPKAEEAKPKPDDKPDDITQMPEGLSPKAQQRFQALVSKIKEQDAAIEQIRSEGEQARSYATEVSSIIKNIGATQDQLQAAAQYIHAFNSGDLNTRKQILLSELRDVSMKLGEPVENFIAGADPLSQFPDLKDAVDRYRMSREAALETARLRTNENTRAAEAEAARRSAETRDNMVKQWETEKNSALKEVDTFTREMAATDPQYPAIQKLIMEKGYLNRIVETRPPSTWVSDLKLLISTIKDANPNLGVASGEPRPLSGGGGKPAGSSKAPGSMLEAMFPGS